jgi:hypothetical protein
MEPRDRAEETAGARSRAGWRLTKSEVATEITSGEEAVTVKLADDLTS